MGRTNHCLSFALLACVMVSARACTVRNTLAFGPGSLRSCIDQASAAPGGGEFFIIFRPQLSGSSIDITDGSTECSSLRIDNPDSGQLLKTVTIRGPRRGRIAVNALACPDTTVFYMNLDVSLNIENVVVEGGRDGILLFGTDFDAAIAESLVVNNCAFVGQTSYGIYAFDTTVIHISGTTIEDAGNDGLRVVESVGLPAPGIFDYSLRDSIFSANGQTSIGGDGADIIAGNGVLKVQDCTFDGNGDDGLQVRPSTVEPSPALIASVIDSNFNANGFIGNDGNTGANGMKVLSTFIGRVSGSSFDGNSNYGLILANGKIETVSRSSFDNNGNSGLELEDATAVSLRRCTFNGNANFGVEMELENPNATIASSITSIKLCTLDNNGLGAVECKSEITPAATRSSREVARSSGGKSEKPAVNGDD